jgi:hypothetical protein
MSALPIALIPMLCVRCQNPLAAQPGEVLWVCPGCGQGQLLSDTHGLLAQVVRYAVGIPQNSKGKPVWVAQGQATSLRRASFDTFDNRKDMEQFWSQPHSFFIPAYDLPLDQLTSTALGLLRQPVNLADAASPAAFYPVTVHPEDIQPLAEYIVLAFEADRKDRLKQLDFSLKLGEPELWVLP